MPWDNRNGWLGTPKYLLPPSSPPPLVYRSSPVSIATPSHCTLRVSTLFGDLHLLYTRFRRWVVHVLGQVFLFLLPPSFLGGAAEGWSSGAATVHAAGALISCLHNTHLMRHCQYHLPVGCPCKDSDCPCSLPWFGWCHNTLASARTQRRH